MMMVIVFFCSSFAPRDFIESLEIDTSDQQVSHICVLSYSSVLVYLTAIFEMLEKFCQGYVQLSNSL